MANNVMKDIFQKIRLSVLFPVLMLNLFGIVFIASSTHEGFFSFYVNRQVMWIFIGLLGAGGAMLLNYKLIAKFGYLIYFLSLLLLIYVHFFGSVVNGARSWIRFGPVGLQPSEFMKLALVIALAKYLRFRRNYRRIVDLAGPFILTVLPLMLILKQPDLGSALVFLPVLFLIVYAVGARYRHLLAIFILGLAALVPIWKYGLADYQRQRIKAFVNPSQYRTTYAYQLIQSKIAIGSGGLTGKGWARGTQHKLNFLPEPHTDFIFAVIAEEWGFIGAGIVLLLFLLFLSMMMRLVFVVREPFARIICLGITILFFVQVCMNVGVALGLMPTTGLTLPFVSYGGSSMLTSYLAVGIVMNAASSRHPLFISGDFSSAE